MSHRCPTTVKVSTEHAIPRTSPTTNGNGSRRCCPRGYDAGKKVTGRKRHIVVDSLGLLLAVVVTAANVQDRDGARRVLARVQDWAPRLRLLWADYAYAGPLVRWVRATFGWLLTIVRKPAGRRGFVLLARRWVIERTFGWFGRYRRLSKDDEGLPAVGEPFIQLAKIPLLLQRLDPPRHS